MKMSASLFEMNDVVNNLRSSASVGAFESTNLTTYRAALTHELFQVNVAESSGWSHHTTSFDRILYTGIPWVELLEYQSRRRSLSTPLEEVLDVLLNPCIVPYAMSSSIAIVLLRVLVEDTMSVSQHQLLKALRRLLETRPSIQVDKWIPYIQANLCLSVDTVESFNVERAHRLVSVCKHLTSLTILKCLLTLLQSIDDVDVKLMQTNRIKKRVESCSCQKRKRRVSNLSILDDDVQDGSGLMIQTVNVMGGGTVERISRVAHHRHAEQCDVCRLPHSARGITQLGIQLVVLRSRIYRKVVSVFNTLADKDFNRRSSNLLQSVVHFSCQHPDTASLRLCIVLLADTKLGCQCAIEYLFTLYQQCMSSLGETVLKVYAEFLVECSHFDKPIKCWEALQPLVNRVTKLCDSQLSLSGAQTSGGESETQIRHMLQCLSFIMCRRRQVLAAIETDPKWQGFTSKVSLAFTDANWWISNDMSQNEKEETLCTLQAVGILGFLDVFEGSNGEESKQRTWPFPAIMGIRSAHRRMGPNVAREGLLSNPTFRAARPHKKVLSRRSEPDDRIVGTPIMDFLNNDVLQIVFSFLGYKRLVKASGVCKAWELLTEDDTLWCQAYASRFPIQNQDKTIAASVTRRDSKVGSWKRLLVNKVLAEKALRFKRHSSGWKHRTCAHIGCLMVLRSPSQMTKHYGTHRVRKPEERGRKLIGAKQKLSSAKSRQPPKLDTNSKTRS